MMRKFLFWLQEHIKSWIKPTTPALIIDLFSDLTHRRTELIVENVLLRQQLIILKRQIKRPQLSNLDRIRLVLLSHFTKFWKQTLHIIQPDTLLSWRRNLFRNYWRRKSQGSESTQFVGMHLSSHLKISVHHRRFGGSEEIQPTRLAGCYGATEFDDISIYNLFPHEFDPAQVLPIGFVLSYSIQSHPDIDAFHPNMLN